MRIALSKKAALPSLLALSVLVRAPLLCHPRVDSDNAVIGLQALHLLRGEWTWFCWGATYRSSIDALATALVMLVAGDRPLSLILAGLAGHLLVTSLVWLILRRYTGPWEAAVACLPLATPPLGVHVALISDTRNFAVAAIFGAFLLIDGKRLVAGALLGTMAPALDAYVAIFLPGLALVAWAKARADRHGWSRLAFGAAIGGIVLLVFRLAAPPQPALRESGATRLALLFGSALPEIIELSPRVFLPLQILAASSLIAAYVWGAWQAIRGRVPALVSGAEAILAASLAAFVASPMPRDSGASRYLASIIWAAPFVLLAAVEKLGARRLALALAPWAASSLLLFATQFELRSPDRPFVQFSRAFGADARLLETLRSRNLRACATGYWDSYRLTYLAAESVICVPFAPSEDRYRPYRDEFESAAVVAYVLRDSDQPAALEATLRSSGATVARLVEAPWTVLVVERRLTR